MEINKKHVWRPPKHPNKMEEPKSQNGKAPRAGYRGPLEKSVGDFENPARLAKSILPGFYIKNVLIRIDLNCCLEKNNNVATVDIWYVYIYIYVAMVNILNLSVINVV